MSGVIDYWCNIFTPEGIRECFTDQGELAEVFRWWKLEDHLVGHSPKEFLALLDRAGVEMVLVPAAKMHSFQARRPIWDVAVSTVAELVEQAPDRIRGLYGIDPWSRMLGVRQLEDAVRRQGVEVIGGQAQQLDRIRPSDDPVLALADVTQCPGRQVGRDVELAVRREPEQQEAVPASDLQHPARLESQGSPDGAL